MPDTEDNAEMGKYMKNVTKRSTSNKSYKKQY